MANACNFIVSLPEGMEDENSYGYLVGFHHDYNNQIITLTFNETPTISIREKFYDEDNQSSIKGDVILGYVDAYGNIIKQELFSEVAFIGMRFNDLEYNVMGDIQTKIDLMYRERKTLLN